MADATDAESLYRHTIAHIGGAIEQGEKHGKRSEIGRQRSGTMGFSLQESPPMNERTPAVDTIRKYLGDAELAAEARGLHKRLILALRNARPVALVALAAELHPEAISPSTALHSLEHKTLTDVLALPELSQRIGVALSAEANRQSAAIGAAAHRQFVLMDEMRSLQARLKRAELTHLGKVEALEKAGYSRRQAEELAAGGNGATDDVQAVAEALQNKQAEYDGLQTFLVSRRDEDAPESIKHLLGAKE